MTKNLELAEKSILGTMLEENYLITDSQVRAEHFTIAIHRNIFIAMTELMRAGNSVDYVTLLSKREPTELGGANYLVTLKNFANPTRFEEYANIILGNYRQVAKHQILHKANLENWDIEQIQKELDALTQDYIQHDLSITDVLVEAADRPYKPGSAKKGIYSDLKDLDKMTNGFQDGELFILAARPSVGKSDTMNHIALTAGMKGYLPIIFSLEMKRESLIDRLIANVGSINRLNLRDPYVTMSDDQKAKWTQAIGILSNANVQIDDRPGLTVPQIRAAARKTIKQYSNKKPIILVDYLQIIRANDPKQNQTQQVGQISWDLKAMAREFNCPVICLSQLNRSVEQRSDKRPNMSDLRDSGNIEQDADVIAFLYRDDYYDKESEAKNLLEIIIAKHRNGPTGTVSVAYIKETGRLINVDWSARK